MLLTKLLPLFRLPSEELNLLAFYGNNDGIVYCFGNGFRLFRLLKEFPGLFLVDLGLDTFIGDFLQLGINLDHFLAADILCPYPPRFLNAASPG